MRIPVVIPALESIYGSKFLDVFKENFAELDIEQAHLKVMNDAKAKGIEIKSFSVAALYAPMKALGFTFKRRPKGRQADPNAPPKAPKAPKIPGSGKRGPKASPVYDKFINDLGGLDETKKYLGAMVLEGISLKIAHERINEKITGDYSYSNITYFAKKLHMEFEKGKRGGNPNLGKNRPSPILDEFVSNFENEDEAKTYLQSLTHLSLTDAVEKINEKIKTEINYSTLFSFAKKFGLEFKRDKARKGEGKNKPAIKGEVEMDSESIEIKQKTPIKIYFKCKECGETKGTQKHYVEIPLGLKGMKCHHCGEWATYVATLVSETETRRFTILNEEGITPDVKIPMETEVDVNLKSIKVETIVKPELQSA
jgi:transposase